MKKAALVFLSLLFTFSSFTASASADELLNIQRNIDKNNTDYSQTQVDIDQIKKDIASLSVAVVGTQSELDQANAKVADIKKDLAVVEKNLSNKKEDLDYLVVIRNKQIRIVYMSPKGSALETFLSSSQLANFATISTYQKSVFDESEGLIKLVNGEIVEVEKTRSQVAAIKVDLEKVAADVASRFASVQYQYYSASNEQDSLQQKLTQINSDLKNLTTKQKQIISKRLAASKRNQRIGDQVPPSTPLPNPGFSPAYAFASYGYPHRVGMNQYGAYGRAKAGQGYKTILRAYYSNVAVGGYPVPSKISVAGKSISFENNYLRGISEMPRSWPMEALKAQAVAARTYALNWLRIHPGQSICTTQACQVYRNDSNLYNCVGQYNKRWCDAVSATRGVVVTQGGSPITAWYASTAGGYTLSSQEVWGGYRSYALAKKDYAGSWPKGAYDKSSPWFHKAWGNSRCGGPYFPWMTKAQVTDLFNAALLSQKSNGFNRYLSPTDGCLGPKGWSTSRVRSELAKAGVKDVGSLSNILIGFDGRGHTSSVTVVSSKYPSGKTFSAGFFSSMIFLRSPGTISLTSNLYDVIIR